MAKGKTDNQDDDDDDEEDDENDDYKRFLHSFLFQPNNIVVGDAWNC